MSTLAKPAYGARDADDDQVMVAVLTEEEMRGLGEAAVRLARFTNAETNSLRVLADVASLLHAGLSEGRPMYVVTTAMWKGGE